MTDPQTDGGGGNHSTTPGAHPGLPRWVKVSAIVVAILVAALVVILLVAGGEHGPGRHGGHAAQPLEPRPAAPWHGGGGPTAGPTR